MNLNAYTSTLGFHPYIGEKHRTSREVALLDGRPFVVGDALDLPLLDNSFDFIIARHLLEHLSDPKRFISEVKRVSKAAYVATPSPFIELVHGGHECLEEEEGACPLHKGRGTPGHKWFVLSSGNDIFWVAKSVETYPIYLLFSRFIKNNTKYERDTFFKKFPDFQETTIRCRNTNDLNVIVLKESGNDIKENQHVDVYKLMKDLNKIYRSKSLKSVIKRFLSRKIFTTKKKFSLTKLLACPICKNTLLDGEVKLICSDCGFFPVVNHIPILLKEALNFN